MEKNILVVDDSEGIVDILSGYLIELDFLLRKMQKVFRYEG